MTSHRASTPARLFAAASLSLSVGLMGAPAAAQEANAPSSAPAPTVTPPRFLEGERPVAPPGHESEEVEVLLEIVIGADGSVRDARVVEPVGNGFDEAAVATVLAWRFEPARRGETPMAARIRYALVFAPVAPAVVEPATETPTDATAPASSEESEVTDEAPAQVADAEVAEPEEAPEEELASFGVTAVAEPPPRDATRRTLTSEVLTRIPGTRGDALRAVELLPGVGRPAFGGGVLLVRGAAPGDSEVFLDGSSVPLLYHFGGLTSFFNSTLLDRIDFVPGNFSVRYGRRIGGILEVEPRDPRTSYHGYLDVNLLDASFAVEGPISDNVTFAVAARRSYIDFFFNEIVPDGLFSVVAAPVYYDYQAMAVWRPSSTDRIRFLAYGSSDELRLVFADPSDNNPNIRGSFGLVTQFHRGQISWRHLYEPWLEQDVMASFGWNELSINAGQAVRINGNFLPFQLRSEWRAQMSPHVRLIGGIDWQYIPTTLSYQGAQPTQSEGQPSSAAQAGQTVAFDATANAYRPGIYLESNVRIGEQLDVVTGIRVDYFREIGAWTADPRLTGRYRFNEQWAIRGGVGLFSQPPEFSESAVGVGNPNLDPIRAIHTGLGADLRFPDARLSFTLDGFFKYITDRVVSTTGNVAPYFVNRGLGRIYGLEVGARLEPGSGIPAFGFLSYTLMRSERQDGPDQAWRLFDFDQTHILTASAVWTPGDGWEAGVTFRLVSGNPYTPVVGSINDLSTGTYRAIYGSVNSDRNPFFNRLDVRVQKRFDVGDFHLSVYLDIQNVYNATNREGVSYNYDYSQSSDIAGLPFIPSIGVRGEL